MSPGWVKVGVLREFGAMGLGWVKVRVFREFGSEEFRVG
jgi:hypothetical protein